MTRRAVAALLTLAALVSACGFHLQGLTRLPPAFATIALKADDRYSEFHQAMTAALKATDSEVVQGGGDHGAVLEVLEDKSEQRVLSISAGNLPTEYEVFYTLRYRVRLEGRELLAPQVLKLSKEYSFNETAVLEKDHEQQLIRRALAQELAAIVLRRLAALSP